MMHHRGPLLIGLGLVIVLAAQFGSGVPIAGAIALIACGATCVLLAGTVRHQRWRLVGNLLVYAALVGLAMGAQLQLRSDALHLLDAAVAGALLLGAAYVAFQRSPSVSNW